PDPLESDLPAFSFGSDYSTLGNTEGWNPLARNDQSYTFNTNASWMKGAHEIRFGFDFMHHLMNHWQPELGDGPRGAFSFGNAVTALNPSVIGSSLGFQGGAPSFENSWNGFAGYLLGTPTHSGKSSQFIKMNSFENVFALYVRDRWRATSKLTLTLGLRWELYPTRTRSAGMGIESYDPTTNEVLIAGRGGIPLDAGVGYSKKLCAPRGGFGYPVGNRQLHRGYIQSWNFVIERKLPAEFVTSVGYVGTSSVNGFAFLDINASQVPGSGNNGRPLYTRFGRTVTTREFDGRTHSTYHSLQATINRSVGGGLFLKGAYTYSHAIDMANYGDWTSFRWNAPSVFSRNQPT